ncbi:uncharacterized protein [Branchiostoma lanceolatum]|uniref:uncharacterized protein n=1 Tax=Branchiostoma lanceolatum TaxID=7740 RepID=UPI003451412A
MFNMGHWAYSKAFVLLHIAIMWQSPSVHGITTQEADQLKNLMSEVKAKIEAAKVAVADTKETLDSGRLVFTTAPTHEYTSLGCWRDSWSRAIPILEGTDSRLDGSYGQRQNAIEKCFQVALSLNFPMFAVQAGGQCFGSATGLNTYRRYGASTGCATNGKGGGYANEVYQITEISSDDDTETASACEGRTLQLSCDAGKKLLIVDANYGRTSPTHTCSGSCSSCTTDCRAASSLSVVRSACQGKQQCTVQASSSIFGGDPCRNVHKYLEVSYRCITERNVALGKTTTASSSPANWGPEKAVDGNRGTSVSWYSQCLHTDRVYQPWWKVDLDEAYPVNRVSVLNRGDCCGNRLRNFQVRIGANENFAQNDQCGETYTATPRNGATVVVTCDQPMSGRYVSIQVMGRYENLQLCEVEVFAEVEEEEETCRVGDGATYRGTTSHTRTGKTCQRWDSQTPHAHDRTPSNYRSGGLEQNYCRNPDGTDNLWCYTTDIRTRWDYCDVPVCG